MRTFVRSGNVQNRIHVYLGRGIPQAGGGVGVHGCQNDSLVRCLTAQGEREKVGASFNVSRRSEVP